MNEVAAKQMIQIVQLERELQEQKGMLWVMGEIIKASNNIRSFKKLMDVITDMLLGVTGVNTSYLWVYHDDGIKVYMRSTAFNNEFLELEADNIPEAFKGKETYLYKKEEIDFALVKEAQIPQSRLVIPLFDFVEGLSIGGLVLEQEQSDFFTTGNIVFFETLGVIIASNAKNSNLYERVAEESETDPLTGVYNRRHMSKVIDQMIKEHGDLVVAVFDADNFKAVNDQLGHLVGDEVIKSLAYAADQVITACNGKVIRYGGDEFILLLPLTLDQALPILENFRASVPGLPVISKIDVKVTITMGVAAYPSMIYDRNVLFNIADAALLKGKDTGKNKVQVATQEEIRVIEEKLS